MFLWDYLCGFRFEVFTCLVWFEVYELLMFVLLNVLGCFYFDKVVLYWCCVDLGMFYLVLLVVLHVLGRWGFCVFCWLVVSSVVLVRVWFL